MRAVEDDDLLRLRGVVHGVGHDRDGDAARVDVGEDARELGAAARVEAGRGLVEDERARAHGQHAGDRAEALLAAGELEGGGVGLVGEADDREGAPAAAGDLVGGEAQVGGAEGDVLQDGLGEELALGVLHDVADAPVEQAAVAARGGVDAADDHAAGVGGLEGAGDAGERGLARAGLADDGDRGAGGDAEAHVVEGVGVVGGSVGEGDVVGEDGGLVVGGCRRRLGRGRDGRRRRRGRGGGEERGEPSGEGVVVDGPVDADAEGLQPGGEAGAEGFLEPEGRDLLGVGEDLLGRAGERDLALAQDDDAVGLEGLLHEVRYVHDRGAGRAQAAHDAHDGAASAHVEQGAGLVEDEQARLHGERAGDGDALLLAAGEARGVGLGEGAHGDAVELAADAALDLGGLDAEVLGAEGDVVLHDRGDDLVVGVLEHEAEALARAAVRGEVDAAAGEDVLAQERHVAGVRGEEPRQHEGERGLARAVGAQDADVLAGTDVERDVVEGERAALVAEGDVGERGHALLGGGRHG